MEHARMVDELPEALAVALRLHEAEYSHEVIATALGIPSQSASIVLKVARLKLDALVAGSPREESATRSAGG